MIKHLKLMASFFESIFIGAFLGFFLWSTIFWLVSFIVWRVVTPDFPTMRLSILVGIILGVVQFSIKIKEGQ